MRVISLFTFLVLAAIAAQPAADAVAFDPAGDRSVPAPRPIDPSRPVV